MKDSLQIVVFLVVSLANYPAGAQTEGFYKDIFMDEGVFLASRTSLPAAISLESTLCQTSLPDSKNGLLEVKIELS